jgi:dTDP-glucose 4,6-dehydratase
MASTPQDATLLVTGGAGFIGSNFVRYWLNTYPDSKIINLDALTYAGNLENLAEVEDNPNYTFVKGDITDRELVNKLMADADYVVHFAAESHVDRSILNPSIFVETNVLGIQILLEAAVKHDLQRFHHISTGEVFGSLELNSDTMFDEHTPYDPRSPYSASKAASDHLVRAYGETYDLDFTISNCSNNYGPYQHPEKFIALTITNLIEDKPIPVYGDGLNVRDWLFVTDHCTAIDRVLSDGKSGETYLVGGLTDDYSNLDIVKILLKIMGHDQSKITFVKDRAGHDRRYAVDWSKINQELGWEPSVSLEEGMELTIEWYQQHPEWWQPLKEKSKDFFEKNYHPEQE